MIFWFIFTLSMAFFQARENDVVENSDYEKQVVARIFFQRTYLLVAYCKFFRTGNMAYYTTRFSIKTTDKST